MKTKKICVIGIGLIGGSLVKAFMRNHQLEIICVDYDSNNLQQAANDGTTAKSMDNLKEAVCAAEAIFICTPVMDIIKIVKNIIPWTKKGTIITDAGSTKGYLMEGIEECLPKEIYFIGGHPMAGSEKSGYINANPELFKGANYLLTPGINVPQSKVEELKEIIKLTGAIPVVMDVDAHDRWAADMSHLPYAASLCLSTTIDKVGYEDGSLKMTAGSLRDMTRVSDSSISMWRDICLTNREEIIDALKRFKEEIEIFTNIIEKENAGEIEAYITRAKSFRQRLAKIKGY